jgi:hypothetical protein
MEKLRVALLLALRFETDQALIRNIKQKLASVLPAEDIDIIDWVLEYAGKDSRTNDLFMESDIMAKSKKMFSSLFGEV